MTIVGGFDVHRQQITFDYVDSDGLVRPAQVVRFAVSTGNSGLSNGLAIGTSKRDGDAYASSLFR